MAKPGRIFTILFSLFLTGVLFFSNAMPAKATVLDAIGKAAKNATKTAVDTTVKAALEAEKGNANVTATTQDVGTAFQTDLYLKIAGVDSNVSTALLESLTEEEKQILADKYGNGAIDGVNSWIAALYNPPASSQTYLADVLDSMHVVPKAQAQGLGFASLDPILDTWKVFRNIAYLFFVIIFLVIGFMIMFRHKIKGQTVVTAQQAIPSVIIALVMVTFSYAIAGLLIDLMYVLMYLLIALFGKDTSLVDMNIFEMGYKFVVEGSFATGYSVNDAIQSIVDFGLISDVIAGASGLTISLIMAIAILIGIFKLFFELLKTYISIILSITFAPIILMFGALPGQNTFNKWLSSLAGNLLVFPAVLLVLVMHQMIVVPKGSVTTGGFMPPYIFGRGVGNVINTVVGVGLILVLPELVQKLKKMLGADAGVFAEFGGQAWKNFKKGEIGVAAVPGVAGAVTGGAISGWKSVREGAGTPLTWGRVKKIGTDVMQGYTEKSGDKDSPAVIRGGAARLGKSWLDKGQQVRKVIDRAEEGRLFEAEDLEKTLTRIMEEKKEKEEKPRKTPTARS